MSPPSHLSAASDQDLVAWARQGREEGYRELVRRYQHPVELLGQELERHAGNDFVLIICTPRYKDRSEKRIRGVGYEGDIITAELLHTGNQRKVIPILRRGEWREAAPGWVAGKYYVDLRDGPSNVTHYQDLVSTILGSRPQAPPVAVRPLVSSGTGPMPRPVASPDEPIRIVGVIVDAVGEPRNDGTRGSALYAVPFRLSRRAPGDWAQVFEQVCNRPPRFTTMHRPGIARVHGDRIVLDGTTVEEVQKYHRDTLILCVAETNRIIAEHEETIRRKDEARQLISEEHKQHVRDVSDKIRFDE
jgi:hypothetical protein